VAKQVIMPKFGFTQESATIIRWLKKPGDTVEQGDPLLEVSTDKVDMEVEAPASGILENVRYSAGDTVPVTDVIAVISESNEPAESIQSGQSLSEPVTASSEPLATPLAERMAEEASLDLHKLSGTGTRGRVTRRDVEGYLSRHADEEVHASPAARRIARERGVDLRGIEGSGPQGRVQSSDVQAASDRYVSAQMHATAPVETKLEVRESPIRQSIPLEGIRKTIAARMQSSWQVPHITFDVDVDVTLAEELRARANVGSKDKKNHVTLTAIIVKVCAWALRAHPMMNSRLHENRVLVLEDVNIGVAVAIESGLIVPVVRGADQKDIVRVAQELLDLADRARTNHLRADDVRDGTFTISNLGMFGIDRFAAIINPPESGILAIGAVVRKPVVMDQDHVVVRPIVTLTLSADHRVVDGALAARFLADVKSGLTNPALLLV
jgi:pyruvate dehydrogenase E2 component (dihydrolipoyllysine-residue acetyltransferase)